MNRLTELRFDGRRQRIWREKDEREEEGLTVERDARGRSRTMQVLKHRFGIDGEKRKRQVVLAFSSSKTKKRLRNHSVLLCFIDIVCEVAILMIFCVYCLINLTWHCNPGGHEPPGPTSVSITISSLYEN